MLEHGLAGCGESGVKNMFRCDKCGECCRSIGGNPIYADLDRGDGVCKYLIGDLCSIYDRRPVLCNIDECYDLYFKDLVSKEEYYERNLNVCEILKNRKLCRYHG